MSNYYEVLGLNENATEKEIKQAYHKLAKELHPDKASSDEERRNFEQRFADVSKAYNVLKDKSRREEFDKALKKDDEKKKKKKPRSRNIIQSRTSVASGDYSKERIQIAKKAYVKGMQIAKSGDYEKSVNFFQAAIDNDDTEPLYYYRLAKSMMKARKSFTKSVEICKQCIEMDPYNMDYQLLLGEIYERAGGYSMAEKVYRKILKWDATNLKAQKRLQMLGKNEGESGSFFASLLKKLKGK